ncbi:MAG TPA: DUF2007 domain-containing protein [Actinomycetota bacterium]|nr:DUF2007 domain-containing protein [Actinomycetota bacterium]
MQAGAPVFAQRVERRPSHPSGVDPDPPVVERGGGGTGWVELTQAGDDIEAHLLSGRLAEAGVETRWLKDRSAPGAWLHGGSNPWAPVTIFVKKLQLDDARLVLAEISWTQPAIDPVAAHASGQADAPPTKRYAVAWWVTAIALGLLFTCIALARTSAVLRTCDLPLVCGSGESSSAPAGK